MKTEHLYLDFHILQTVPPSCVNRDDTGSPKTAIYGGTTRARVSSQAWKRAVRIMLPSIIEGHMGVRTKQLERRLLQEVLALKPEIAKESATQLVDEFLNKSINEKSDKAQQSVYFDFDRKAPGKLKTLFFFSDTFFHELAEYALNEKWKVETAGKYKKNMDKIMNSAKVSWDIALFGRMAASNPKLGVDACCQVAHAISTHAVRNEFDYFTAVDDCAPEDNAGVGHLGTVEFNSSTLYRYATINVTELEKNLEADTIPAILAFAEAFIRSMPTGKQNTFANRTVPDLVYVTLREDQPVNLVNAFETAVPASSRGYAEASVKNLYSHAETVYQSFVERPAAAWCTSRYAFGSTQSLPLSEMMTEIEKQLLASISSHSANEVI